MCISLAEHALALEYVVELVFDFSLSLVGIHTIIPICIRLNHFKVTILPHLWPLLQKLELSAIQKLFTIFPTLFRPKIWATLRPHRIAL